MDGVPVSETQFISTHALTEGDAQTIDNTMAEIISTHALTEGDRRQGFYF